VPGYKEWFATSEQAPVIVASTQSDGVACGAMFLKRVHWMLRPKSAANALSSSGVRGSIVANRGTSYCSRTRNHMRTRTLREFCDDAARLTRSKEPILLRHRGRLAGIFWPTPKGTHPLVRKRALFPLLSANLARAIKKRKLSEAEILTGFEAWRKRQHRAAQ